MKTKVDVERGHYVGISLSPSSRLVGWLVIGAASARPDLCTWGALGAPFKSLHLVLMSITSICSVRQSTQPRATRTCTPVTLQERHPRRRRRRCCRHSRLRCCVLSRQSAQQLLHFLSSTPSDRKLSGWIVRRRGEGQQQAWRRHPAWCLICKLQILSRFRWLSYDNRTETLSMTSARAESGSRPQEVSRS